MPVPLRKKCQTSGTAVIPARMSLTALPDEALPRSLKPMLARLGSLPESSHEFTYEKKWDRYRPLARVHAGAGQCIRRNGIDRTVGLPELTAGLPSLPR